MMGEWSFWLRILRDFILGSMYYWSSFVTFYKSRLHLNYWYWYYLFTRVMYYHTKLNIFNYSSGDSFHSVNQSVCRQVVEFLRSISQVDTAQTFPRTLCMCRRKFDQGFGDSWAWSCKDCYCWQLSSSIWISGLFWIVNIVAYIKLCNGNCIFL